MRPITLASVALVLAASEVPGQELRGEIRLRSAPLRDAAVFLERVDGADSAAPPRRARLDQRNLAFVPRVLVVSPGSTVEFPNSDPVMHNVFHPGAGEDAFDLGTYSSAEAKSVRFDRAGFFVVLCHVHPEMVGYIAVVRSRLFAVTDDDGTFRMDSVPAGTYRLHVWQRRAEDPAAVVSVPESRTRSPIVVTVGRRERRRSP